MSANTDPLTLLMQHLMATEERRRVSDQEREDRLRKEAQEREDRLRKEALDREEKAREREDLVQE